MVQTRNHYRFNNLIYMAERGFPLTRTMVKAFAWAIAKRSGRGDRFHAEYGPVDHWWALFKKHHPQLALRQTDSLEHYHAEYLNPIIVNEYLKKTLTENDLLRSPRQIYNCDETFLPLDYTKERAVTAKGSKNVFYCAKSFLEASTGFRVQMMQCTQKVIQVGSILSCFLYG